jgi:hypothetical protein
LLTPDTSAKLGPILKDFASHLASFNATQYKLNQFNASVDAYLNNRNVSESDKVAKLMDVLRDLEMVRQASGQDQPDGMVDAQTQIEYSRKAFYKMGLGKLFDEMIEREIANTRYDNERTSR